MTGRASRTGNSKQKGTKFKKRISPFILFSYKDPRSVTGSAALFLTETSGFHVSPQWSQICIRKWSKGWQRNPSTMHLRGAHPSKSWATSCNMSFHWSIDAGHPKLVAEKCHLFGKKHQNWKLMMSVWVCTFPTAASCCKRKAWLRAEFFCFSSETIYRRLLSARSSPCLISFGPFQNVSHGTWAQFFVSLKFACHMHPPNPPHPSTECLHVHFLLADHSSCQALEQSACAKSSRTILGWQVTSDCQNLAAEMNNEVMSIWTSHSAFWSSPFNRSLAEWSERVKISYSD